VKTKKKMERPGCILHDLELEIPTACGERGQVRKTRPLGRGPCTNGGPGFSVCVCVCVCVCVYHVFLPSLCFPRPAVVTSALTPPARPRPPALEPVRRILTLVRVLCRMVARLSDLEEEEQEQEELKLLKRFQSSSERG